MDYINPFSDKHNAWSDLKKNFDNQSSFSQKAIVGVAASFIVITSFIVAVMTLGTCMTPAFRWMVKKLAVSSHPTTTNANAVGTQTLDVKKSQNVIDHQQLKLSADDVANLKQIKSCSVKELGDDFDICIYFYKGGVTGKFGNFSPIDIQYNGKSFKCVEGGFQHQKYWNVAKEQGLFDKKSLPLVQEYFQLLDQFHTADGEKSYDLSKKLGTNDNSVLKRMQKAGLVSKTLPMNWDQDKLKIMFDLLTEKFNHKNEREFLLATGNAYLLEHNPRKGVDSYWSDDSDGTGKNMLGRMLMAIRLGKPLSFALDDQYFDQNRIKVFCEVVSKDPHNFNPFADLKKR